jgi:hypothetical protein
MFKYLVIALMILLLLESKTVIMKIRSCPDSITQLRLIDHASHNRYPLGNTNVKITFHIYNETPEILKNISVHAEANTFFRSFTVRPSKLCDTASNCIIYPGDNLIHSIEYVPDLTTQISFRTTWRDSNNQELLCLHTTLSPKFSIFPRLF